MTSDSAMPPTPVRMTRTETSECLIFSTSPIAASTEPCTSALMTRLSSRAPPSLIWREQLLERDRLLAACELLLAQALGALLRLLARDALRLDDAERARRRAAGDRSRAPRPEPTGPASLALRPWSSSSARTLPQASPATSASPARSVPRCTSTVATGPRPMSSRDSITTPCGVGVGLALSSQDVGLQQQHLEQLRRARCAPWRRRRRRSSSPPHSSGCSPSCRQLGAHRARGWRRGGRSC